MTERREPLFELHNVSKVMRGRTVFHTEQLTFYRGESCALIGANGSGKTTLLRLLADMIPVSGGQLKRHLPPEPQMVAYLPQKPYVFSFSVQRNVMIAIKGLPQEQSQQLALRALEQVGIEHLKDAPGNRLSGGESQRLALARLLVQPHRLLLLDEPSSATDIAGNETIERALNNYLSTEHTDLIFATHALSQAKRLADRVLFLHAGRIIEDGTPEQVLGNPQTPECQKFVRFWQA